MINFIVICLIFAEINLFPITQLHLQWLLLLFPIPFLLAAKFTFILHFLRFLNLLLLPLLWFWLIKSREFLIFLNKSLLFILLFFPLFILVLLYFLFKQYLITINFFFGFFCDHLVERWEIFLWFVWFNNRNWGLPRLKLAHFLLFRFWFFLDFRLKCCCDDILNDHLAPFLPRLFANPIAFWWSFSLLKCCREITQVLKDSGLFFLFDFLPLTYTLFRLCLLKPCIDRGSWCCLVLLLLPFVLFVFLCWLDFLKFRLVFFILLRLGFLNSPFDWLLFLLFLLFFLLWFLLQNF